MFSTLFLIPAIPLASFLALVLFGRRMSGRVAATVGTGSVALSMVLAFLIVAHFVTSLSNLGTASQSAVPGFVSLSYTQSLWQWFRIGTMPISFGLHLDGLSLVMVLVISLVGFLIHLYSTRFMAGDDGYPRFFAYMNLFVASMFILVLADNLLFLYLGWEGVGLCSYLLIGFWYRDPANGRAAMKAFVVTRVGDTAFAVGLLLLFTGLGSLNIREIGQQAPLAWPAGSLAVTAAAALLLGGAVGKSAQLPLQTWLPDAMAGPTPVSALIHAATMVTAGVYLIARMHTIFELAPGVQLAVAVIGAVTLLMSALSALCQKDIKRVLAYSTMSQIGYMFLALGVGAWPAAIFHFMTHAFFKALLFLSAGVVIQSLANEHDISRMGGLRRELPLVFWSFLIGASSLSALPFVTAGFYSKEMILSAAWHSPIGGHWLWAAGTVGAALTALYAFRVVFMVFFGHRRTKPRKSPMGPMAVPLIVLATLSIFAGVFRSSHGSLLVSVRDLVRGALSNSAGISPSPETNGVLLAIASAASLAGVVVAVLLYGWRPEVGSAKEGNRLYSTLGKFWFSGWGFDRLYDALFVGPYTRVAHIDKNDFVDAFSRGLERAAVLGNKALVASQSGLVRWYVFALAAGAAVFLSVVVYL
jgi:NADH-quinone oxidoreductase subunit L